jgi:hypothetical protein
MVAVAGLVVAVFLMDVMCVVCGCRSMGECAVGNDNARALGLECGVDATDDSAVEMLDGVVDCENAGELLVIYL